MTEPWVPTVLLGLLSACVVVMTAVLVMTAGDLRRLLRHAEAVLPDCTQVLRDVRQTLGTTRRLLSRANRLGRSVESVVTQACQAATATISDVLDLRTRAQRLLGQWTNGAGSGPRRHARREHGKRRTGTHG